MFIKDADPIIIKDLKIAGQLFKKELLRAHLSVLLALRFAAHLYRAAVLVYPDHAVQASS